jgi:hypothetical protein
VDPVPDPLFFLGKCSKEKEIQKKKEARKRRATSIT